MHPPLLDQHLGFGKRVEDLGVLAPLLRDAPFAIDCGDNGFAIAFKRLLLGVSAVLSPTVNFGSMTGTPFCSVATGQRG